MPYKATHTYTPTHNSDMKRNSTKPKMILNIYYDEHQTIKRDFKLLTNI